jgi:site-specific DNA-methyltransferase (adenine-specific)
MTIPDVVVPPGPTATRSPPDFTPQPIAIAALMTQLLAVEVGPTQKPVGVMRWLIHAFSNPGELVGSLFCGVAPRGIAAIQLGRRYQGIELSPEYRRIAKARIAAYGWPK